MNPENDDERRSKLRELEGKNVSYYSVLLTTIIQSELDGIKNIINLSSAGIGFLLALEKFGSRSACIELSLILEMVSFLGFIFAIVCGVSFLSVASKRYEDALRENDNEEGHNNLVKSRQSFSHRRKASMIAFLFGIIALAGLGIVAVFFP